MNRSYLIAGVLTLAAILWIATGTVHRAPEGTATSAGAAPATPAPAAISGATALPRVQTRASRAADRAGQITLTGRTEANLMVTLRAETRGRVIATPAERGARVAEGGELVRLAIDDRALRVAEARALLAQRQTEANAAGTLNQRGFSSDVRAAETRALLEAARAQLSLAELDLARTRILAPFDGWFVDRTVELGSLVDQNGEIGTFAQLDPIKVVGFVSERFIAQVQLGQSARIAVGGSLYQGTIAYISPAAEPNTRTFRLEVSVPNPNRALVAGQTAELILATVPQKGHKIIPSILSLSRQGALGVKTIDATGTVSFAPVEVLAEEPGALWVSGLPEQVDLIVVGQDYVGEGQMVTAVPYSGPIPGTAAAITPSGVSTPVPLETQR